MSQINTNIGSLVAQRTLAQNNETLNTSLKRLSTGYRINNGGDDPAGLIASETLRSEKAAIKGAIANAERASQVVNIAEGGLQEISSLLVELQSLVSQSGNEAGLSEDEKEANQQQIDSILQTIDRIAESTSFQGTKLLNGTFDFTVSGQTSQVLDFQINAAKLNTNEHRDIQVVVTQSAQHGGLFLSLNGTALDLSASDAQMTFEVGGADGVRQFSFASGTATSAIAASINSFKSVTGVSAVASGDGIFLKSDEFGSDKYVSVDVLDDAGQAGGVTTMSTTDEYTISTVAANFTALNAIVNPVRDVGQDVGAIINGVSSNSKGTTASISTEFVDLELNLSVSGAQNLAAFDAFTITGGGAKFNLGPGVNIGNQVSIGIENVASRNLGSLTNGTLDSLASGKGNNVVDGDIETAQLVIDDAINQLSRSRGRLGAIQKNVIGATIRSLGVTYENISAAESAIRDTDFAEETAELTRSQILVAAATNALSIANSQPQNVLGLLG